MVSFAAQLRQELSQRNSAYAKARDLPHESSYGELPVTVYEPYSDGKRHGNFFAASYRAILKQVQWKKRLEKAHTQSARSLPRTDRSWKELDSCMSSDALLMNIFCHPRTLKSSGVNSILGSESTVSPKFGFPARVPLGNGRTDRTEVDMKLGELLIESKLTEADFQTQTAEIVESYRDLKTVFEYRRLPRAGGRFVSYQLIRNVLAAHALKLSFCVLLDARRPDLIEGWYLIMSCVKISELRTRCKVLTWQELAEALTLDLQTFLDLKYGIVPAGCNASKFAGPEL
jgi:hypothetical protein